MLKRVKEWLFSREYRTLFVTLMGISLGLYLLLGFVIGRGFFSSIFYVRNEDAFMDFFNSIRDSAQGMGAYLDRKIIYPPMANLVFFLFSKLIPAAYNNTEFVDRYQWMIHSEAVALIVGWIAFCAVLFFLGAFLFQKGKPLAKTLCALGFLFSVPFLTLSERGNLLVLCLFGLLVYMRTYHSEKAAARELGLICLSFSVSLKLYPALFAWLLIGDRRWKDFIRVVIYSILLLILPTFAFGDPSCLLSMVRNIFSFSSGNGGALGAMGQATHLPQVVINGIMYGWFLLSAAVFAVSPFLFRERWMVWMAGCVTFLSYPPLTTTYAWILFVIPLTLMFNEGMSGKKYFLYFLAMSVPFLIISIPVSFHVTANALAVYVALLLLTVLETREAIRVLRARCQKKTPNANI